MRQLDLFSSLQSSTEGIDTEFKSARGGLPGSFWESYSAFANTQGGTIVLGVAEKPIGLVWEGVPDAAQLRTVLWNQLNDRNKVSANLLRDDDVRTVDDEGRQFVVVNVPRASRLQRPVFVGPNPMNGTFRRADEGDYRCSDDEVWPTSRTRRPTRKSWSTSGRPTLTRRRSSSTAIALPPARQTTPGCCWTMPRY